MWTAKTDPGENQILHQILMVMVSSVAHALRGDTDPYVTALVVASCMITPSY